MIAKLETDADPLYDDYVRALNLADTMLRYGRACGDYPLLGGGDTNLYRLFVERSTELMDRNGLIALLTPSGIYGDQPAARFFGKVSAELRLLALYDFENRRGQDDQGRDKGRFFTDVHPQFNFCTVVLGGADRTSEELSCGFVLHDPPWNTDPNRLLTMRAGDFALVNPKTGTAPIFLTQRDADIVLGIYHSHPILETENANASHSSSVVRYKTVAHMTNDSEHFWTSEQLQTDGWYSVEPNRWRKGDQLMLPLYQARMIHRYDHRYNSVRFNPDNLYNPYVSQPVSVEQHQVPTFYPRPQYWIHRDMVNQKFLGSPPYAIGFRNNTRTQDDTTLISTLVPWAGYAHSLPILACDSSEATDVFNDCAPLWVANLSSFAIDFVAKRKMPGTNLSNYVLQQLPVITRAEYERRFGSTTAADLVRDHVLRLCYTAWDLQPFAPGPGLRRRTLRLGRGRAPSIARPPGRPLLHPVRPRPG